MPSSITANLTSFGNSYLGLWKLSNQTNLGSTQYIAVTSGYDVSGNVITQTTGTIPLITGDLVYLATSDYGFQTGIGYIIKLSNNTFSLATTKGNALNSITANLSNILPGTTSFSNVGISNVPLIGAFYGAVATNSITNTLVSSSKSAQSFAVTDNVSIDFTVPSIRSQVNEAHNHYLWTCGLDAGSYTVGFFDDGTYFRCGDTSLGLPGASNKTSATSVFRITLQNRQISIANRRTNSTYITLFTSSVLSLNLSNLRFFTNLTLDGQSFTNCTITYL